MDLVVVCTRVLIVLVRDLLDSCRSESRNEAEDIIRYKSPGVHSAVTVEEYFQFQSFRGWKYALRGNNSSSMDSILKVQETKNAKSKQCEAIQRFSFSDYTQLFWFDLLVIESPPRLILYTMEMNAEVSTQ